MYARSHDGRSPSNALHQRLGCSSRRLIPPTAQSHAERGVNSGSGGSGSMACYLSK